MELSVEVDALRLPGQRVGRARLPSRGAQSSAPPTARALMLFAFILFTPGTAVARGQSAPATAAGGCDYERCALAIAPRWNGLALVRGAAGTSVATLSFFWPRDVGAALRAGSSLAEADSAVAQGRRALVLRRAGAALTDLGALAIALAAGRALSRARVARGDAVIAAGGALSFALSVPLQFAADGALSRAVWWHNARYALPPGRSR